MKYIVDGNEMKQIDSYTIHTIGIESLVLMERAALEIVNYIKKKTDKKDSILAVCGTGNNGGDGIAAARILYNEGYHVTLLCLGSLEKQTIETKQQYRIAKNIGVPVVTEWEKIEWNQYTLFIDAIFGIGLSREINGIYGKIIENMNQSNAKVLAVDIPSGIDAKSGGVMGIAVKADATVTFGCQKLGMVFYPGCEYAGKVTVADIGFPSSAITYVSPSSFYYTKKDLENLPLRKGDGNKGTFGKVLVIAGMKNISGAAYFAAKAAYRTGAGLVKIVTAEENRTILQASLPEALFQDYDQSIYTAKTENMLLENLNWANAIAIGPGIGKTKVSQSILQFVLEHAKIPIVIDADAIHLLKYTEQWKNHTFHVPVILTPHLKEMSELTEISVTDVKKNLIESAANISGISENLFVALKDAVTVVSSGTYHYINLSGNNGMATGGSGDILTGVIAALLAQGSRPFTAASLGVYVHGLSGDISAKKKGSYGVIAEDIIENIPNVLKGKKEEGLA